MTRWPTLALLVALVLAATPVAWAQTVWDPDQYGAWIEEGSRLYEQAVALPPEAGWRRRELLRDSARVKLLARGMLRAALVSGAVDHFRDSAETEYFNLCENLVVHLTTLDQCEAADLLIDQVEADTDLLPAEALTHLRGLGTHVASCRERVARPDPTWAVDLWRRLGDEAGAWRRQANEAGAGPPATDLRFEAAQQEQQALDLLRRTLLGTRQAPGLDDPAAALRDHYARLLDDLAALGACDVARRRLQQWRFDADLLGLDTGPEEPFTNLVESCRPSL